MNVQLFVNAFQMAVDRLDTQIQLIRDRLVSVALRKQDQNLFLAGGQAGVFLPGLFIAMKRLDDHPGNLTAHRRTAAADFFQGVVQIGRHGAFQQIAVRAGFERQKNQLLVIHRGQDDDPGFWQQILELRGAFNAGHARQKNVHQSGGNGSGITANGSLFNSSNPNAPEGTQVAFLQRVSAISQVVSGFVSGARYEVTFSAAQRAGQFQGPGQTWDLKLAPAILASYSPPKEATNYADYTAEFTASAASHTLAFIGTNLRGGDNTVFIDNVRVTPDPSVVPPPLVMGLGDGHVSIEWPLANFGWRLQVQTNSLDPTSWATVSGADLSNHFVIPLSTVESSVFFRLVFP